MNERLTGEWVFIKAVGGLTGKHIILPPADSRTTLIFSNRTKFKINVNGNTTVQGNYKLIKVNSIFTAKEDNTINFVSSSREDIKLISIQNDSLWLTENHVEPYGSLYIRMKLP